MLSDGNQILSHSSQDGAGHTFDRFEVRFVVEVEMLLGREDSSCGKILIGCY